LFYGDGLVFCWLISPNDGFLPYYVIYIVKSIVEEDTYYFLFYRGFIGGNNI
jgi:hypothetical protein